MKRKISDYASPEAEMLAPCEHGVLCSSPSGLEAELSNITGDDVTDASGNWNF